MKNAVIIVCVIVLMAASFAAGWLIPKSKTSQNSGESILNDKLGSKDEKEAESKDDIEEASSEKAAKNVFFSPKTGSDETGDGSQHHPFETKEKAEEYASALLLAENEELCILEFLMSIDIKTSQATGVGSVNMIPFTGSSDGAYFTGEIVGTGYDTQKYGMGSPTFSARYMLKGKDYTGQSCGIFIENQGDALDKCTPTVVTDSTALSEWQSYNLRTIVTPVSGGVIVDMYRIH